MKKIIVRDETIEKIVNEYVKGVSINDISKKYKINTRKISNILKSRDIEIRGRRKFYYNEDFFEKIDNNLKAYWLGFLYADGCIRDIKGAYVVKIKLSGKDENHLFSLLRHLKSNQKELREEKSVFKGTNGKMYTSYGKVLLLNSKKMVKDLVKHGCVQNKTYNLSFPNIDKKYYNSFILGYFDGDGCITTKNVKGNTYYSSTITCSSKQFLEKIKNILSEINISGVGFYDYGTFHRIQITNKIDLLKFRDYLYGNNDFYLKRKKNKFNKIDEIK